MIPEDFFDALLASLTPREEMVLRCLYGLRTTKLSASEAAKHWGVGPSRIHQIRKKALLKVANRLSSHQE